MEGTLAMVWLMVVSVGILITIVYMRRFTNDERKIMIDKGINPGDLSVKNKGIWPTGKALWPLRFSLLFIGAGLGLMVGYFLDVTFRMQEVAYFSSLFIFGGAGLGISYIIEEKKDKAEREREEQ